MNRSLSRSGFTLIEAMSAVAVSSMLIGVASRPVSSVMSRSRVNAAATVLAGDLELAFALAQRESVPVRVAYDSSSNSYTITSRSSTTARLTRTFASDFAPTTAAFSPAAIDVFPSGLSSSQLTVTLSGGGRSRQVVVTRAGQIRGGQ